MQLLVFIYNTVFIQRWGQDLRNTQHVSQTDNSGISSRGRITQHSLFNCVIISWSHSVFFPVGHWFLSAGALLNECVWPPVTVPADWKLHTGKRRRQFDSSCCCFPRVSVHICVCMLCVYIPSRTLWGVCAYSPGTDRWALWCHAERPGFVSDQIISAEVYLSPSAAATPASLLWPTSIYISVRTLPEATTH